ncbi:MAG: excisionase family DNA-binding protein [Rhodobiaceae bacterium]|nr:excisionase family DNA-binding protein [Rhodobiaceae bacterium]
MLALMDQTHEPFVADEAEAVIAKKALDRLKGVSEADLVKITVDGKQEADIIVPLPRRAVALICDVLEAMANRTPVSLIPHEAELTTQQAADYLNVSRPYLIREIEAEKLPCRKVGTHRRIKFADLVEYESASRERQKKALADLNKEALRLGLE